MEIFAVDWARGNDGVCGYSTSYWARLHVVKELLVKLVTFVCEVGGRVFVPHQSSHVTWAKINPSL